LWIVQDIVEPHSIPVDTYIVIKAVETEHIARAGFNRVAITALAAKFEKNTNEGSSIYKSLRGNGFEVLV
jgi:hypothetical protein